MLDHAIDAAQALGCERIVVVVGDQAPAVARPRRRAAGRRRRRRAGPAARHRPRGAGGQGRAGGLRRRRGGHLRRRPAADRRRRSSRCSTCASAGADVAVLGFEAADPGAYGRLVLGEGDLLERIVEAKDASAAELAITPATPASWPRRRRCCSSCSAEVGNDNAKGEYYLTDVVGLARARRPHGARRLRRRRRRSGRRTRRPSWPRPRPPSSSAAARRADGRPASP